MRRLRSLFALVSLVLLSACDEPDAEDLIKKESTIAEQQKEGTVFLNVDDDGKAQFVVKNSAGTIVTREVEGQLIIEAGEDAEPIELKLEADPERGVFTANLPTLKADATSLSYSLKVEGKTLTGNLIVPEGGTEELTKASLGKDEDLAKGEHGGVLQVVDGARMEVVANASSGEVRVYPLDDSERPKKVEVVVDVKGEAERIELEWGEEGYFVADLRPGWVPRKTTLIVTGVDAGVHVALVGLRVGVVIDVDHRPIYWEKRKWKHRGLARGHYKGTHRGPPGHNRFAKKNKNKTFDEHRDEGKRHQHDRHEAGGKQVASVKVKAKGKQGDVKVKIHAK